MYLTVPLSTQVYRGMGTNELLWKPAEMFVVIYDGLHPMQAVVNGSSNTQTAATGYEKWTSTKSLLLSS